MKKMLSLFILAICMITVSGTAFAWSPQVEGKPDVFSVGEMRGYFVWHDDNGFHVRTTTRGGEHRFSGEVRTDGQFVGIDGTRLEETDRYKVSPRRHAIKFDFDTQGGQDGLDFHVRGGERVTFDLYIDGHKMNTNNIFIGDRGFHPRQGEFTLYR